ncbi:MAG: hypothetical protein MZV65_21135 [Chromatiales bacterium]|nr:hypothetical protein [Chromatiales bacterium]
MRHIVGVRAEKEGRVLNFQTSDETLKKNDAVIVNTENGPSVGIVATDSKAVPLHQLPTDIRNIVRKCTDEDLRALEQNQKLERDAREFCFGRIRERGLPMKLIERGVPLRPQQAHLLLHRGQPRRFPRTGEGPRPEVQDPDRTAPDRGPQRIADLRRARGLRPEDLLHQFPATTSTACP